MTETASEAMRAIFAALESEDLDALALAIEERGRWIESGAGPSVAELEEGDRAWRAIEALKQRWALEHARLQQVREGFAVRDEEERGLSWQG
jgi:hypothetical protein